MPIKSLPVDSLNILKTLYNYIDQDINLIPYLNSFIDNESLYENDFDSYSSYIFYKVLTDCIYKQKTIVNYESYVYNVLKGFSKSQLGKEASSSTIARIWTSITEAYSLIISLSSDPNINSIITNNRVYNPYNIINAPFSLPKFTFHSDIPITFEYEDHVSVILILPYCSTFKSNMNLNLLIKRYKSLLKDITIITINKGKFLNTTIKLNNDSLQKLNTNVYLDVSQMIPPLNKENYKIFSSVDNRSINTFLNKIYN